MITKEEVGDVFNSLPKESAEIASFLIQQGIKGEKGNPYGCPIASFFYSKGAKECTVFGGGVIVRYGLPDSSRREDLHKTVLWSGEGLKEFTGLFDEGFYPELEIS